ncbi:MAG: hypothetical protein D9V44_01375 [Actinobacteria bacterium]|nr:MAG: hypothetical protein D9V44_01375 [Actinomycetota bacterium]
MNANGTGMETPSMPVRLSLLWVFIMFNMVFADILSFMYPGFLSEVMGGRADGVVITPGFLLVAAVLAEIPIAMIVLSRVLRQPANRWANIIAGVITIVYVAGGSSTYPHGIFFSALEVGCALLIIGYAWRWREPAASPAALVGASAEA